MNSSLVPLSPTGVPDEREEQHGSHHQNGVVHVFLGDRHVVREDEDDRNEDGPHTGVEHDRLGELAQAERTRRHTHFFRVDHEEENHQHVRPVGGDGADGENSVHGDRGAEVDQGQQRVDESDHPQTSERHTGGLVDVVPERRERNAAVSGERPERSADGADGDGAAEPEHDEAQRQVRGGSLSAHRVVKHLDDRLAGRGVENRVEVVAHAQRVDDVEDPAKERGHGQGGRNGQRRGVRGVADLLGHSGRGVVARHDPRHVQKAKQERPAVVRPARAVDDLGEDVLLGINFWALDQHGDHERDDRADVHKTVVLGDSGEHGRRQRVDEAVRDDHGDRRAGDVAGRRHVLVVGSHGNGLQQQRGSSEIGRARSSHGPDEVQPSVNPADKRHVFFRHDVGDHIVHSTAGRETRGDMGDRVSNGQAAKHADEPRPRRSGRAAGPQRIQIGDGDGSHEPRDRQGERKRCQERVASVELLLVAEMGQLGGVGVQSHSWRHCCVQIGFFQVFGHVWNLRAEEGQRYL
ncbi:hypothetical protein KL909_002443 [Ogataea angusta]|nr:hypothetical protein KL909_002443 [Ogataea angusta]